MNNTPQAYILEGITLCTNCAFKASETAFIVAYVFGMIESLPRTMDEVVMTLMTLNAMKGQEGSIPEPYAGEFVCSCGKHIPAVSEVA